MLLQLGLNRTVPVLARRTLLARPAMIRGFNSASTLLKEKPYVKIDSLEPGESELLIAQRKTRPISPHLTIYQPQLTWYLSSVHRVSLIFMGGAFYLLTILFGGAALLGMGSKINTESVTNWYHSTVSKVSQLSLKTGFAYLFAFHYALAVRHMVWDAAKELTLKGVYRTGYAAIGFGALVGTYLLSL
ncbi:similar to Saccharomyces cerevisiae YMR118C Protein of unknown function with similarity to succinate dehydrogenase cytochrome b subunit [Maudiozyma barnettii]|uniref:Uncharacterized protein n=1 Tax=Maudiozyma barnettii TaxID=61262 RepID=A0A8H2ZKM4_9SACH|nr:uncharacterized protein KABA2_13S03366 [Kazachstania barnettii]CAB4257118.1 similar to Saccharomyces cerevisiae YMR118C Protein of unknown function with similarity to succinate dehydrogenase cytochrome b subunit [Kazachstania barnettii]CAD1779488.1 similar to Saccharomyces cerevisiae YMR118C Protein of unknown function with similarity to succinate dehydrogenase cytochrome b subunit [Kazachstania barnettii]